MRHWLWPFGILAIYASLTAQYVPVFHDEFTLWSHVVQVDPHRPRAQINLGHQYWIKQDWVLAVLAFRRALTATEDRFDVQSEVSRMIAGSDLANLGAGILQTGSVEAPWCLSVQGTAANTNTVAQMRLLVLPRVLQLGSDPCPAR